MTGPARAPEIILASASPRRRELLQRLGLDPRVVPADIVEIPGADEAPAAYVERLAREKAAAVAAQHPTALILAGDTTVVLDDRFLEKPADEAAAVAMLEALSGRTHDVLTALAVVSPPVLSPWGGVFGDGSDQGDKHSNDQTGGLWSRVDRTVVRFRELHPEEIAAYVATGEPMDKAGAYGIQGVAGAFVSGIEGDYFTVVGLSLHGVVELLRTAGWIWRPGQLERAPAGQI